MLTDPDNFDVFGPNGIDCATSERIAYQSSAANPISAPTGSINVTRDLTFWVENLSINVGAQWQTHNPDKGARVGLQSGQPLFISADKSVLPPGAGTSLYRQLCTFAGADYQLHISFVATANTDNSLAAFIRFTDGNNNIRVEYTPSTTTWALVQKIAGIDTTLASGIFDLASLGVNGEGFIITLAGANVTISSPSTVLDGTFVTAHLTGGPFAFFVDAAGANVSGFGGDLFFQNLATH